MKIEEELHKTATTWFATIIKYYPKKYKVEREYELNRQVVYNFKEGIQNTLVMAGFVTAIQRIKVAFSNNDLWLCPIPASTVAKTHQRFYGFCETISASCNIHNGYSLLTSTGDRSQVHIGASRNYEKILESIAFGDVKGKRIILCDDVVTTGKSFNIIANHLKSLGALSVVGVMLAKTHWLDEEPIFTL